jgi:two-component system cell cycle response regulator DivK
MAEDWRSTALVVDDYADTRRIIRRMLELRRFSVEAGDGAEAVEAARLKCPDLILMDLSLPRMDGLDAARKIRELNEECERVVIVAFTAFDTYGMREAALAAGCNEYVVKPIDFSDLDRILHTFLRESRP